jgi:hypothetical protein
MKHQHVSPAIVGDGNDSSNGIAFAEFKGYDAWRLIATSQHDGKEAPRRTPARKPRWHSC